MSFAAALVSLLAAVASGAGAAGQGQQPVFRSSTDLVEVDVVVTADGRFVDDLTAADFEVLENGRPQPIQTVYLVDGRTGAAGGAARRTDGGVERIPGVRRVLVWLFDREHLSPGSFKVAHAAVQLFLADGFRDGDIGAVIATGSGQGRLTGNREALVADLERATPVGASRSRQMDLRTWPRFINEDEAIRVARRDAQVLAAVLRRAADDEPQLCAKVDCEGVVVEKAQQIVASARAAADRLRGALDGVLSALGRVQGRKALVFITEGFVVEGLGSELRQLLGAAARAGVTIYAVDARGLDRRSMGDVTQTRETESLSALQQELSATAAEDAPNALAVDTGGFVIRNTNQIRAGLDEIAEDAGTYYVLGYAPDNRALDGSFRRIEVRVKRAGVSVRARRGYIASPAVALVPQRIARPGEGEAVAGTPPASAATPPSSDEGARELEPVAGKGVDPGAAPAQRQKSLERIAEVAALSSPGTADAVRPAPAGGDRDASQGWARYSSGDVEGAQKAFAVAAARLSAPPWVHYALGQAEFALGHYAEAARAWERVRQAAPQFEPVHFDLADTYLQLGDFGEAIEVLRAARQRWPDDPEVYNALGVIQTRRGALDDAIASFSRAVVTAPADATGHFNLARAYEFRYVRSRRYSRNARSGWMANEADRRRAIEHYRRCLEIGSAFDDSAREALQRLEWKP